MFKLCISFYSKDNQILSTTKKTAYDRCLIACKSLNKMIFLYQSTDFLKLIITIRLIYIFFYYYRSSCIVDVLPALKRRGFLWPCVHDWGGSCCWLPMSFTSQASPVSPTIFVIQTSQSSTENILWGHPIGIAFKKHSTHRNVACERRFSFAWCPYWGQVWLVCFGST